MSPPNRPNMANLGREGGGRGFSLLENEEHLDDSNDSQFFGATLSITPDNERRAPLSGATDDNSSSILAAADKNANLKNEQSKAMSSPTSKCHQMSTPTRSTENLEDARNYFASGAFANAVQNCRPIILENIDGRFQDAWLLTEIDHWDNEKERLVFLLERSFIVIKYDFITLKILDYRRIMLQDLDQVTHGKIMYPQNSLMPPKTAHGVRAMWNKGQPLEFSKNWNPWSRDIPFITLTAHRLFYSEGGASGEDRKNYSIDRFKQQLLECLQALPESQHCIVKEEPIVIENYVGLVSAVHNITDLGFFKARGRVSF